MRRTHWTMTLLAIVGLATVALSASPAHALADLRITAMTVQGTARVGTCNKVSMTVRNDGDAFTGNATLDIALYTFPSATPSQNRVTKTLFISPMQPGAQVTFPINNVEFKAAGQATLQAVVDSTSETEESSEGNNGRTTTTNVSGSCNAPPPRQPPSNKDCDIEAIFTAPSGSSVTGNQPYTYQVRFTNKGVQACDAFKVKLMRYNNTTCSGYGSQIGGSRNWQSVGSLRRNGSTTASFTEKKTPGRAKACLQLGYSPNNYSDANNQNHRPKKVISYHH